MSLKQKRLAMLSLAVPLLGIGVGLFLFAGLGSDPYTAFNLAVAAKTGIDFGTMSLINNAVLLVLILFFHRHTLGAGTVLNMIFVGYIADYFMKICSRFFGAPQNLFQQLLVMMAGVITLSLSASLYFTAALGLAPYDTMAFMVQRIIRLPFAWCRILTDTTSLVLALLLGGSAGVGVGTFVCACCLGPFINFFNNKLSIPLLGAARVRPDMAEEKE